MATPFDHDQGAYLQYERDRGRRIGFLFCLTFTVGFWGAVAWWML